MTVRYPPLHRWSWVQWEKIKLSEVALDTTNLQLRHPVLGVCSRKIYIVIGNPSFYLQILFFSPFLNIFSLSYFYMRQVFLSPIELNSSAV